MELQSITVSQLGQSLSQNRVVKIEWQASLTTQFSPQLSLAQPLQLDIHGDGDFSGKPNNQQK